MLRYKLLLQSFSFVPNILCYSGVFPSCLAEQKRLSSLQLGHFAPKCKSSGRYRDVQCYRKSGYCWCVDEYGKELMGTRVTGIPICSLATGKSFKEVKKYLSGFIGQLNQLVT